MCEVAFSPDGNLMATGGREPVIKLWDVQTGEPICTLDHEHGVLAAAFSPDGKLFACGGLGNDIKLWAMPVGDLHAILSVPAHHKVARVILWHAATEKRLWPVSLH